MFVSGFALSESCIFGMSVDRWRERGDLRAAEALAKPAQAIRDLARWVDLSTKTPPSLSGSARKLEGR